MKVEIMLDDDCQETKIMIITDKIDEEISQLENNILNISSPIVIAGNDGENIHLLKPKDIIRIYTAIGKVFAVTNAREYLLRLRLYEVEEKLRTYDFVRISNSEIINIEKTKKFDFSLTGTIRCFLSNGDISFVSRRYVNKIKKTLGI